MTYRIYRCGHTVGEPDRIDADCLACQRDEITASSQCEHPLSSVMVFNTAGPWFFPQRGCLKCNQYLDPVRMRSDAEYRHLLELDKADAMRNAPPIHQVIRECRERVMVALSDTPSPAIGDRASGLKACAYLANMDVLDRMRREARK